MSDHKSNGELSVSTYNWSEWRDGRFHHCRDTKTFQTMPTRKLGVLLVGIGGNNGSTFHAACIANSVHMKWHTRTGEYCSNFLGSMTQTVTIPVGYENGGYETKYAKLNDVIDLVNPHELVVGGWDISGHDLSAAMRRSGVLDTSLQDQITEYVTEKKLNTVPLPSVYYPSFIASNQASRADNTLEGETACDAHLDILRENIASFRTTHDLGHVVVMWTATTERMMDISDNVHGSAVSILDAIKQGHTEISPSLMFGVASVLEGCTFLNGSPQNTLVPGLIDMAQKSGTHVSGSDFKTGQTKLKSCLADFFMASGFHLTSVVSYNHLGNNDGKNLSSEKQFMAKRASKTGILENILMQNPDLYSGSLPDHEVVIRYVPNARDDKKALDEYVADICMGGSFVMNMQTTCPDSLLATPIMLDLVLLADWLDRLKVSGKPLPTNLTPLSFFFKAPQENDDHTQTNSFHMQLSSIYELALRSVGLPPVNSVWP
jgi:myo-inositol-1-phosphate synthase